MRTTRQTSLQESARGFAGGVRFHPRLLQSVSAPYVDRQSLAGRVRTPYESSRLMPNLQLSTESSQHQVCNRRTAARREDVRRKTGVDALVTLVVDRQVLNVHILREVTIKPSRYRSLA